MAEAGRPKVGIGVFILKGNKMLLGKRKNAHGEGEYAAPGGHLEHGESFETCALREVFEEVGPDFVISRPKFLSVTNQKRYLPLHYVNIGVIAKWKSGKPEIMEPDKIESWDWYDLDSLPKPLFEVMPHYVEAYRTGKIYFR